MLHITNGSSVSLADTGLGGDIVFWADVLQEGPVPAGLDLAELTRLRITFLTGQWPETPPVLEQRDAALRRFAEHDEVILWFEHDLYDQLQLIQILDWFHGRDFGTTLLRLICIGEFPGMEPFYGLGQLTGEQLKTLWPTRRPVSDSEFDLASAAWRAFRSPDPMEIQRLLLQDTSALPFLKAALELHLEEYPEVGNGLTRTERQILEQVDAGTFRIHDTLLELHLHRLSQCRHPLLEGSAAGYRLTQTGHDVLAAHTDHIRLNGINRWLGGVHLDGFQVLWRWDTTRRRLVPL